MRVWHDSRDMRLPRVPSAWFAPVVLALSALLAVPVGAAAAPPRLAPSHRLDPEVASGFWTPSRVRAALAADSMARRRPAAGVASASSLRVIDAAAPQDRANGRLFGFDPRQGPYSCSGTSLATPSESIVLTAGHCVLDGGSWGAHIVFVPAFDHDERPFGTFAADSAYVTPQWKASSNSDFDVAALKVLPDRFGTLTQAVGAKGWTSGRSRYSTFQIFGYPAAALRGEELRSCLTHGLGSDALTDPNAGPPTVPAACDMAGGASGGAWLVDGGETIDGVTSYGYTGNHTRLYSPYFGPQIDSFLRQLP